MLLDFDGEDDLETEEWAANGDWDLFHPQQRADDDNFDETGIPLHEANFHDQTRVRRNNLDDYDYQTGEVIEREVEESFMGKQSSLIAHFSTMFNAKKLQWPKGRGGESALTVAFSNILNRLK